MKFQKLFWIGFFFIFLVIQTSPSPAMAQGNLPLVVVVATGGTIAEKKDPQTGSLVPAVSGQDLIKAVPEISRLARIQVKEFSNIDSSHMTPQIWARLSRETSSILARNDVAGVVITHGTDTMAEAAFFLDVTLGSAKPVVLVGAMRGASELSPDGPANIRDAISLAASPQAQNRGAMVILNQYIWAASCVEKTRTSTVQTFNCGWQGALGNIIDGKTRFFNQRSRLPHLPLPTEMAKVFLITTFAGDQGAMIRAAIRQGAQGIVLEALGQGNVNPKVFQAVKQALAQKITMVITTRVPYEPVLGGYGDVGGGSQLEKAGAILSRELRGPKARLLLMLALPQVKEDEKLKELFK
jgi:L-asparaginase